VNEQRGCDNGDPDGQPTRTEDGARTPSEALAPIARARITDEFLRQFCRS
jgi:hypothetical protein